jgi:hypothetical protein
VRTREQVGEDTGAIEWGRVFTHEHAHVQARSEDAQCHTGQRLQPRRDTLLWACTHGGTLFSFHSVSLAGERELAGALGSLTLTNRLLLMLQVLLEACNEPSDGEGLWSTASATRHVCPLT